MTHEAESTRKPTDTPSRDRRHRGRTPTFPKRGTPTDDDSDANDAKDARTTKPTRTYVDPETGSSIRVSANQAIRDPDGSVWAAVDLYPDRIELTFPFDAPVWARTTVEADVAAREWTPLYAADGSPIWRY